MDKTTLDDDAITNAGERMVVGNAWGYWAHLSIYRFAQNFAQRGQVLDAGSGSGYGSAYLARHGAQVLAFDVSTSAIEYSRQRYAGDTVRFEVADLNSALPLGDGIFDLVFSSNVFEHVGNVDGLAAECARVVKPEGIVIVAVPPICWDAAMAADMENPFHVHHIPPTAWHAKLLRFFTDVRCHAHVGRGEFASKERERLEMALPPDRVSIRETDFEFPETTPAAMQEARDSITAVFVCRGRRLPPGCETLQERTPADWREGEVAARLIGRASNGAAGAVEFRQSHLAARIAALEASTSWRVTAPMRAVATALRGRRWSPF